MVKLAWMFFLTYGGSSVYDSPTFSSSKTTQDNKSLTLNHLLSFISGTLSSERKKKWSKSGSYPQKQALPALNPTNDPLIHSKPKTELCQTGHFEKDVITFKSGF